MADVGVISANAEGVSVWQRIACLKRLRVYYDILRNRYYRKKLIETRGVLANGVQWRFAGPESRRGGFRDVNRTHVQLIFEDPCVVGIIMTGRQAWRDRFDIQLFHEQGRQAFVEALARRGYRLADPDDPKGFFVRPIMVRRSL